MKNRKGFMLAELIVTATVVIATIAGLYASYNRIYNLYKERNNYYDVDGIYATNEIIKYYMERNINEIINENMELDSQEAKHFFYMIKDNICQDSDSKTAVGNGELDRTVCQAIQTAYNVKNMIFTEYDKCTLKPSECTNTETNTEFEIKNNTFKDYIEYVIKQYNIKS